MSNYNSMKDGFQAPFIVYPSMESRPGQIWPGLSVYVRAPLTSWPPAFWENPGLALVVRGFPPVCVR